MEVIIPSYIDNNTNKKEYSPFKNPDTISENGETPFIKNIYYDKDWNKIIETLFTFYTGSSKLDAAEKTQIPIQIKINPQETIITLKVWNKVNEFEINNKNIKELYNSIFSYIKESVNTNLWWILNPKTQQKVDFKIQTLTHLLLAEVLDFDPTGELTDGKEVVLDDKKVNIFWNSHEEQNFLEKITSSIKKFFQKWTSVHLTIGENRSENIVTIDISDPDSFLKFKKEFIQKALNKIYNISENTDPLQFYNEKLSLEEKIKLDTTLFEIYQKLKD